MNLKRLLVLIAALPVAALPATGAIAQTATTDGTTEGTSVESSSEATAVNVADQVVISRSKADTRDGGSAEGTAIEVFGETVSGGTQEGEGSNSGELVGTGETPLGSVSVAPWSAEVDGEGNSRGQASAARVVVVDEETATVDVLHSEAEATKSGSRSETTGAEVDLGGGQLFIQLLHSETNSDGEGSSWVANINDNKILTDEQVAGGCEIPADPLVHLLCLYAEEVEGENGESGATAGVADVVALDDNLHLDLHQTTSTQAPAGEAAPAAPAGEDSDDIAPAPAGDLPRTGAGFGPALLGLLSLGSGAALKRWARG